jgi:hypothetical protein
MSVDPYAHLTDPDAWTGPPAAEEPSAAPVKGRNRKRTRSIRERMAETGENYTTAMRALDAARNEREADRG